VQEQLVKETKRFNQIVSLSLEKITENSKMFDPKDDLKKFYEQLSEA
jgi:ubiquinone biosynthesis protein UbiJ